LDTLRDIMKIIVCVKPVSLIVARTGDNPDTQFVSAEDRVRLINPYDLVGVEEALRIKETIGAEVVLLTLGPLDEELPLKRCWAMGADRLFQIEGPSCNYPDHRSKATLLASAIQELGADLVICGKKSVDSEGQQVGAWLAQRLGTSYVSGATYVKLEQKQNKLIIHRALERGDREIIHCDLPAVITVEMGLNEPRYPTLPNTLWALEQKIPFIDGEKLGLHKDHEGGSQQLESLIEHTMPRPRPRKVLAPDRKTSAMDRMKQVMSGGFKEKEGKICKDTPQRLGQRIIDVLKENGFIKDVKRRED
jgi:electron transfer flavoprotein beta subunit